MLEEKGCGNGRRMELSQDRVQTWVLLRWWEPWNLPSQQETTARVSKKVSYCNGTRQAFADESAFITTGSKVSWNMLYSEHSVNSVKVLI
jgi:hypothetical protein